MISKFIPALVVALAECKNPELRSFLQLETEFLLRFAEQLEQAYKDGSLLKGRLSDKTGDISKDFSKRFSLYLLERNKDNPDRIQAVIKEFALNNPSSEFMAVYVRELSYIFIKPA